MDIGIKKVLGNLLKKLRTKKAHSRLTQKEFSEVSGLHVNTIHLLEQGANEPRISTFIFLAKAFDIEPEELMKLLMEEYYKKPSKRSKK